LRQTRAPIKKKVNSMKESVSLPKGYQRNDWINEHVETFVEQTQKLFDTVSARCDCPEMTAGPGYSYLWADGVKVKKPIALPAAEYIRSLFIWVESDMKNQNIFPTKVNSVVGTYPKQFLPSVKNIFKRLFRVYAHVYHHHFKDIVEYQKEQELNSSYKWFYFFVTGFDLVERKDMEPLKDLQKLFDQE